MTKGVVANVTIAEGFLSSQLQLTQVNVSSLNLRSSVFSRLPTSLMTLALSNDMLTELSTMVTKLTALKKLYVIALYNNASRIMAR